MKKKKKNVVLENVFRFSCIFFVKLRAPFSILYRSVVIAPPQGA